MSRITQQQLESYLWGAATLLRGTVDAGDYKQFIFPLLFYKRLCDVFDEETLKALRDSGGDEAFAQFPENHRFQIPPEAHWQEVRKTTRDVGRALQQSMRAIEIANQNKLYNIFGDAQWTNKDRLSDSMLRDLVEHFSTLELTVANLPEDELGQGYEFLIKKFADDSGHTAAEFYTNRTVVHLMTEMLDVQPGESVYDPTCGSGGMLLSCIAHLRKQGKEWRNVKLFGQERNLMTSSIARMNCFLHGIEDFRIERGDTLADPKLVEGDRLMKFNVVLANPPYSIKQWDREAFASDPWGRNLYGTPPQGRADYAFQQHILQSLKREAGRCGVLWPHGVLFRQEEDEMRKKMVEADLVEAVIGLGPNLFYNASMESCVVICRASKAEERRGKILFISAQHEVARERSQSFLTAKQIQKIVTAYKTFKGVGSFASVATLDDVRQQDYSLKIDLYVRTSVHKTHGVARDGGGLGAALRNWDSSRPTLRGSLAKLLGSEPTKGLSLAATQGLLASFDHSKWKRVRFGDVVKQMKEQVMPQTDGIERYVAGEHMETESVHIRKWGKVGDGYLGPAFIRGFRKGQVLYGSRRTYLKKVAVAEWDGVTANTTFVLETVDGKMLQELLPWLMLSDRFTKHSVRESKGSTNPYINFPDIAKFEFDLPPLDQQHRLVEILWCVEDAMEAYKKCLNAYDAWIAAFVAEQYLAQHFPRVRFEEIITSIVAGKSVVGVNELAGDGQFGVLKVSAVGPKGFQAAEHKRLIDPKDFLPRFAVNKGDFLITRCNTKELVGRVCIVPDAHSSLMLCDKTLKIEFDEQKALPGFFEAVLKSQPLRMQIESCATGTGGAMKNISQDNIRAFVLPLPSLKEQRELLSVAENGAAFKTGLESALNKACGLRGELSNSIFP
jgi:type I restriction enzyme M protein